MQLHSACIAIYTGAFCLLDSLFLIAFGLKQVFLMILLKNMIFHGHFLP